MFTFKCIKKNSWGSLSIHSNFAHEWICVAQQWRVGAITIMRRFLKVFSIFIKLALMSFQKPDLAMRFLVAIYQRYDFLRRAPSISQSIALVSIINNGNSLDFLVQKCVTRTVFHLQLNRTCYFYGRQSRWTLVNKKYEVVPRRRITVHQVIVLASHEQLSDRSIRIKMLYEVHTP